MLSTQLTRYNTFVTESFLCTHACMRLSIHMPKRAHHTSVHVCN